MLTLGDWLISIQPLNLISLRDKVILVDMAARSWSNNCNLDSVCASARVGTNGI
jgi:hypothetical protein